ncbi:MAG TPA: hypothetical protein VN843_04685, partial [Anaerolineales bacterium]|nr:hypothetical protein [Anaerolineales bacterium]
PLQTLGNAAIFGANTLFPSTGKTPPPAKIAAFQTVMFGNVIMEPAKIAYLFCGHGSGEKLK